MKNLLVRLLLLSLYRSYHNLNYFMFTLSTPFHVLAFSYFSLCAFEFKWDSHILKELKQNSFLFTAPLSNAEVTTNLTKATLVKFSCQEDGEGDFCPGFGVF